MYISRQHIKKQRHYFANKSPSSQGYGFSGSHVWMWELDYKESWAQKNWCFWIVVLEKTLESPLDCKEIKPVHPKGNQSWIFIGRTDAETPILWPPDVKNWLTEKTLMLGKIEGRRDDRGWDDWMASLTWWTWVWASSGVWWQTGKPGVMQSMGLQTVGHDWATELNWTDQGVRDQHSGALAVMWNLARYLTSTSLSFPIYRMWVSVIPISTSEQYGKDCV